MPELDSAFELGPSFNINLTGENFHEGWALRFPLRGVTTLSTSGAEYIGYVFNPRFTLVEPRFLGDWKAKLSLGLLFGSRKYHDYYYSVAPQYVTDDRSAYNAEGGFSGTYVKASMTRRSNNFWYGFSVRYDNVGEAEFSESPLVETDNYLAVSFVMSWFLWASDN